MLRPASATFLLLCSIAVAGCGGTGGATCTTHDECASGFCKTDGTCGPADVDAAPGSDAPTDGTSGLCTPNHDGMITAGELPLIAGKMATFRVATDATFDTTGAAGSAGMRSWNLAGQLAGDADRPIALIAPAGTWWAASFPTASYATPLSAELDLLGVFRIDASAVTLLGVVSPAAGASRTELAYDPPAKLLALPFARTSTWTSTSTVSGTAQGFITAYTEKYSSTVDQGGMMETPYGAFPVVRVATDLTRTSGFATLLTKRSFAWVAECFGSVATAASQDFESAAEFDDPAEVRRLAP
ncbi:MAG: hypothetical protein H0X17_13310 [Deltaproteobacteria bacterium]|nr:hypothetical protein [Deltaproteobacteria bacterium]